MSETVIRDTAIPKQVIFYGAGMFSTYILGLSPEIDIYPPPPALEDGVCFIDIDTKKHGTFHLGLPILSVDAALEKYKDADIYITLDENKFPGSAYDSCVYLIKAGFKHRQIINGVGLRWSCHFLENFIVCGYHERAFFGMAGDDCGSHSLKSCCSDYGRNNVASVPTGDNLADAFSKFLQLRDDTIHNLNEGKPTKCDGCPELEILYTPEKKQFYYIIYNELGICNSRCIYCNHDERYGRDMSTDADFVQLMKLVNEYGFDKENGIVELCNGEITIHPQKYRIYEAVKEYRVMFLTNGLVYDEFIQRKLLDGSGILNLSIDSGTRETFEKIKGLDAFDRVIGNLREYATNSNGVLNLKYIILPGINDNLEDIDGFVDLCIELPVTNAHISYNLCLPYEDYNNEQTIFAIKYMIEKLNEHSIPFEVYFKNILDKLI